MPRAFASITFTPSVKAAQTRYGSRDKARHYEDAPEDGSSELGEREAEFIAERDSFYMATVSESGWPYVQHRGGPAGFAKVLGPRTMAWADFRGNLQYLSMGNLGANERVSIIMMDYAHRRRLKIWGRARIVDAHDNAHDDAALMQRVALPGYQAKVERAVVIEVEAIDWNCPQHITARYSLHEVEKIAASLLEENAALRAELAAYQR